MTEETLSDFIGEYHGTEFLFVINVKEFIKKLKEKLCNPEFNIDYKFNERWIDKLAGEKLK